jgi:hypothetical protein
MRWLTGITKEEQISALTSAWTKNISLKRVLALEAGRALIYLAFLLGSTICIQAALHRSVDGALVTAFSVVVPTVGALAMVAYRKSEAPKKGEEQLPKSEED